MAFFKISKHVFNDPPTLGAVQSTFKTLEKINPYADGLYDFYKVTGPGIPPEDNVEIELTFQLVSAQKVNVTWKLKK